MTRKREAVRRARRHLDEYEASPHVQLAKLARERKDELRDMHHRVGAVISEMSEALDELAVTRSWMDKARRLAKLSGEVREWSIALRLACLGDKKTPETEAPGV